MFSVRTLLTATSALLFALTGSTAVMADQFKTFGDYVVHYNAMNTGMLAPDVARRYGIKRSKNRGLFTLSVQKKVLGTTGKPVEARITGYATNLSAQTKPLTARKIVDGNAIYYIGDFRVAHRETLDFHFTITPAGENKSFTLTFRKQFFAD